MSSDSHKSGSSSRRNQDEDTAEATDVARKSIFILKAKPHSLRSAENFLGNRNWDIRPTTDVKMALMSLLKEPVDYALIGVDHANPNVTRLPDILSQTLKIPIILFAESMTPQSSLLLRSSKYPHILFPPVSGPSIERMLLKIEKEKTLAASEKAGESNSSGQGNSFADQDMAKVFAGEGQSPMLGTNLTFGAPQPGGPASKAGLFGLEGRTQQGDSKQNGISYDPRSQGFNPSAPDLTGLESNESLALNLNSSPRSGAGPGTQHDATSGRGVNPGRDAGGSIADRRDPGSTALGAAASDFATGSGSSSGSGSSQSAASTVGFRQRQTPSLPKNPLFTDGFDPHLPSMDPLQALANLERQDLLLTPNDPNYKRVIEHQSILSSCTKMALTSVAIATSAPSPLIPLLQNSNVACFDVESPNVSGVVVVAFGSDRQADAKFTHDLRGKVLSYMKEHDIDFTVNDAMNLKIERVEFQAWSANEALFLHKSVHAGDEIALSFFMNSDLKTPLEVSEDSRMLKISIDEIRTGVPLDFDVYLHFPANQKYVRYVGRSGTMTSTQWNRLTAGGVSEMHVQKASAPLVKRYRVQNFINDTVEAYIAKKTKAA